MKKTPHTTNGRKSKADGKPKRGAAELIVELAKAKYRFGMSTENEPFAVARDGNGVAVLLDQSTGGIQPHLAAEYHKLYGKVVGQTAVSNALEVLRGQLRDCRKERLHLRVAPHGDQVVIDIGDETGRAIVVTPGFGWEIVDRSPVLFRRNALTAPLVIPVPGGTVEDLRRLVNVSDRDFELLICWLVAAMVPDIPHPVLLLSGVAGTGKTKCAEMLLSLFDPSTAPLCSLGRDEDKWHDLVSNRWGVLTDNVSTISPEQSDLLCKAVTGDSLVRRKLYTNREVVTSSIRNVVLITSIDPGAIAGDLGERIIRLELEYIPPDQRIDERTLQEVKTQLRPKILGALLDGLVHTLERLPHVAGRKLPRMADFGKILAAAEDAEVAKGALERFWQQQEELALDIVDSDSFGAAVKEFALKNGGWQGTATALLEALWPDSDGPRPREWPKANRALRKISQFIPQLRSDGILIDNDRKGKNRTRMIYITLVEASEGAATPPVSEANDDDWSAGESVDHDSVVPVPDDVDDRDDDIPF